MIKVSSMLIMLLFLYGCGNVKSQHKNSSHLPQRSLEKIFKPSNVLWDTLSFEPESEMVLINKNFQLIYFDNDSTLFLIKSLNEVENDSLLCCVENVELFKGKCSELENGNLLVNVKKISKHADCDNINHCFSDTLKIETPTSIIFQGSKYNIESKVFKESYQRIEKILLRASQKNSE